MPVYDNKFFRTKIKIYNNKVNTNFRGNKIPEDNECCACLSVKSLHSMLLDMKNIIHKYF